MSINEMEVIDQNETIATMRQYILQLEQSNKTLKQENEQLRQTVTHLKGGQCAAPHAKLQGECETECVSSLTQ